MHTTDLPTYEIITDSLGDPKLNTHQVIKALADIDARLKVTSVDQRQGRRFLMTIQLKSNKIPLEIRRLLLAQVVEFLTKSGLVAESKAKKLLDGVTV